MRARFSFQQALAIKGLSLFVCMAAWLSTPSFAQNIPNAGTLQQQINRDREIFIPKEIQATELPKSEVKKRLDGPKVTVKAFKFVGNTVLDELQLKKITEGYTDRSLEFFELELASGAVAELYRSMGFVVRTSLPPQDIKDGVVTMEIVEANFGKVVVEPFASKRLDIDRIVRTINAAQKAGEKLNTFQIDKALALLADLSGVQIQGSLVEGDSPGQTNLMVTLKETALVTLDASSDNTGSRSTGQNRLATSLAINSPLGLGDQLAINTLSSSGTQYVRLSEYMPVGYAGSKFGLNLSHLNYHLVTQDYAALLAKGTADTLGLETTYPLVLSRLSTLTAVLGLDGKHFVNQSQNTVASDYVSRLVNLGLNGTTLSSPMSQTRSSFNMGWVGGQLDLSQSANRVSDANTVKTSGRFNKFKYTVSRDQEIVQGFSFYSSLNGQWASKNLDSSEKFYLGGINGVRAYPSNEAGGALGQLASVELRSRLGPSSLFSGFYDHGRVLTNPNNDYPGASVLNKYALKGYGFSYAYGTAGGSSIKATVARRIGNNPNPTTTGNDQDGSMVKNRFWLNASVPF